MASPGNQPCANRIGTLSLPIHTSRDKVEDAAEAGVVGLDRVGVQFKDQVAGRRVVASSDHRQAAAQLVVPDRPLVHLRTIEVQVELEPVRAPVTQHHTHTHTHTRLTALCPGLPGWAGTIRVKPIWILLEQEIVSGSGISWACASLHLAPDR